MRAFQLRLSHCCASMLLVFCLSIVTVSAQEASAPAAPAAPAVEAAPAPAAPAPAAATAPAAPAAPATANLPTPAAAPAPAAAAPSDKMESRQLPDTGVRVFNLEQGRTVPTTIPEPKSDLRAIATDSREYSGGPLRQDKPLPKMTTKLWRGVNNTLFGWVEIPKAIITDSMESDPFTGVIGGIVIGTAKGVERTGVGVLEILTFPHEWPKDYAPLLQPVHVLDDVAN